jgi:hypothetical protein
MDRSDGLLIIYFSPAEWRLAIPEWPANRPAAKSHWADFDARPSQCAHRVFCHFLTFQQDLSILIYVELKS